MTTGTIKNLTLPLAFCVVFCGVVLGGIEPSPFMNYQGVLRDGAGAPLDGTFDMVFRFFDAPIGGNEILVDQHLALGTGAVTATSGLSNVALGSGDIMDGPGPGTVSH